MVPAAEGNRDITPDGKLIGVVAAGESALATPQINVVRNWFDELKQRVPIKWWLSAASVWELSIKSSLKRLVLPAPAIEYIAEKVDAGLRILSVEWVHAAAVERLPFHHRDLFDRLLVAQAKTDRLAVVTDDAVFPRYGVRVVW